MKEDKETLIVINIIKEHLGFEAEKIPESIEKRADIRARKNNEDYLFEVKSRNDHPELAEAVGGSHCLEIINYAKDVRRSNSISSIIEEAQRQLKKTPKSEKSFLCLWFRVAHHLIPDEASVIRSSLYGIRYLLVSDSEKQTYYAPCYYFDYSDFYRFQSINAVIIDNGSELLLCVNNYSTRIHDFRNSELHNFFSNSNAFIDPDEFIEEDGQLVVDLDCPRNQVSKIKEYIYNKYGLYVNNVLGMKAMAGLAKCLIEDFK